MIQNYILTILIVLLSTKIYNIKTISIQLNNIINMESKVTKGGRIPTCMS